GPAGELRWEECITQDGFEGPYTIAYHLHRPHEQRLAPTTHGWTIPTQPIDDHRLLKRHYKTNDLERRGGASLDVRVPLLWNDDVTLAIAKPDAPDPVYFVDGDADTLVYVFQGGGTLRTMLGDVRFTQDDYVFVPR